MAHILHQTVLAPLNELQQKALEVEKKCQLDRRQLKIYNSVLHAAGKLSLSTTVEKTNNPKYRLSNIGLWASDLVRITGIRLDTLLVAPHSSHMIFALFPGLNAQEIASLKEYVVTNKQKEDEFEKLAKETNVDDLVFGDSDMITEDYLVQDEGQQ